MRERGFRESRGGSMKPKMLISQLSARPTAPPPPGGRVPLCFDQEPKDRNGGGCGYTIGEYAEFSCEAKGMNGGKQSLRVEKE